MNITDTYPARLRHTQSELAGAAEAWLENVKAQLRVLQVTSSGRVAPRGALEKTYQLSKGLTQANVRYVYDVARASLDLMGSGAKTAAEAAKAVKDDAVSATKSMGGAAERFEGDMVDASAQLRHNQQAQARRAHKAVHDVAAERYEDMTKVELSEELGDRGLKKSGNVEELRERLIDDDAG